MENFFSSQTTGREALSWQIHVDAPVAQHYVACDTQLDGIYAKAKAQQWDIEDYDWSFELAPDNPLQLPDATLLVYGTPVWEDLDSTGRSELRRHFQAWTLSQVLHGEQGALLCAAKLAQGEPSLSGRLCMVAQCYDEARHVEVYARLVNDKIGIRYGMSSSLENLLRQTVSASELDMTNLGMQVLVEGIALSIFQNIVAYSADPTIKQMISQVQRDEARHFAAGRITLARIYRGELTSAEMAIREEFVCESMTTMYEHLCADDIWAP
ncbi:MAG TPA: ferritin-like domain-containing protein, partial [Candidatus Acidoferrum sp.]|nr:ferritin-like domain-containing protein [Candidatus Acidoferrum sp.]